MHSPHSTNHVLASLSSSDADALRPHMQSIDLPQGKIVGEAGKKIDRVIFPNSGIISVVVPLTSGEIIEIGMIGRDSVLGASVAIEDDIFLNRAIVQVEGAGTVIEATHIRWVAAQSPAFRATFMKHERILLAQSQQSAACNALHALEARLARWLLRARDALGSDDLALTQEFLSQMLGVRRTSVSLIANTLQKAGVIKYRRGHINILNVEGLRECACECYASVKSLSDRLMTRVPG
jgi:CRP-like cAMP-binding protein